MVEQCGPFDVEKVTRRTDADVVGDGRSVPKVLDVGDWDPAVLGAVDQHDGALHAVLCGAGIVVAGSGRDGVVARGARQ